MLMRFYNFLTGGRPMRRREWLFTDVVSGNRVYRYEDRLGRSWMAEGPWSWFRVEAKAPTCAALGEEK